MDFQSWIGNVEGAASIYAFDIHSDGSFSEIRLMAFNSKNFFMNSLPPEAPKFYPGIPYRTYFTDLNFESFVYKSASTREPLYSYVNARGVWLKGFYLPIDEPVDPSGEAAKPAENSDGSRTVYCLYTATFSPEVETDSMNQRSTDISNAVMNISIKLHETNDFYQNMAAAAGEIMDFCGAERCSLYMVDTSNQKCCFINRHGVQEARLKQFAEEMECTPFELAMHWEKDLANSDCLLLDDLKVIEERDPLWYRSLNKNEIRSLILFAVRFNHMLVGYIWAANFDTSKMMKIKETLELSTFMIGAVIANHQLVSRLEVKSSIDGLTQVSNRNAMNERVDAFVTGREKLPERMGIVFADLNGLKTVNDKQGHDAGDRLLSNAGSLLRVVFGEHEIYRAGGDEFVVFCPDIGEKKTAQLAAQLRALADSTEDVSFAIGTVSCSGEYDICRAMQTADENMYKDKEEFYRLHPEKDRRKT